MKSAQKILYATGLSLLLSTVTLFANPMSAEEIAQKTRDYLNSKQTYAFEAMIVNHADNEKNKHQVSVKVNRPDQLRFDVKGDIRNRSNYLNEGQYTVMDHDLNNYVNIETPKNIDDALDRLFEMFEVKIPLANLIYSNMGDRVKFKHNKNFGIVDLEGMECHYIAFSDNTTEVHIWINTGDEPLVQHFMVKDKTGQDNKSRETTISWKGAKAVSPSDFVFKAPKNAKELFIQ
jgi:hypothetical protein